MQIYGERGWYGLSFDEISRRAKVGKALLYSRWSSAEDLLPAAFRKLLPPAGPAQADIRDELIAEARRAAELFLGPYRLAVFRLSIDGMVGPPVLSRLLDEMQNGTMDAIHARVRGAMVDGQLPASTSPELILQQIEGAVLLYSRRCPPDQVAEALDAIGPYAERLVDWALAQAGTIGVPGAPSLPLPVDQDRPNRPETGTPGESAGHDRP
jgi:AcrR family transcriptional regulator